MRIRFQCRGCGVWLSAGEDTVGKRVKCAKCGHLMAVARAVSQASPARDVGEQRRGAGEPEVDGPSSCPSCGKRMPEGAPSCDACVLLNARQMLRKTKYSWLAVLITACLSAALGVASGGAGGRSDFLASAWAVSLIACLVELLLVQISTIGTIYWGRLAMGRGPDSQNLLWLLAVLAPLVLWAFFVVTLIQLKRQGIA